MSSYNIIIGKQRYNRCRIGIDMLCNIYEGHATEGQREGGVEVDMLGEGSVI